MARKRQPKQPTKESQNDAATATIEAPSEQPVEAIAVEAPPVQPVAIEPTPTFVERIGDRSTRRLLPDPFMVALDNDAGVRLFENRQARVMALKFDERPPQAVIDRVKEHGYRWNPEHSVWTHSFDSDSAMATRIEAERLYQQVRNLVRQDKEIGAAQDIPF